MVFLAKAMMLLAAGAVLFALVCPLAATPMPVGAVKRIVDAVAPLAVPLLMLTWNPFSDQARLLAAAPEPLPADGAGLSCVLNC